MTSKLSDRFATGDLVVCRGLVESTAYRDEKGKEQHYIRHYFEPEYDTSYEVQRIIKLFDDLEKELAGAKGRIVSLEHHVGEVIGLEALIRVTGDINFYANVDMDDRELVAALINEMEQYKERLRVAVKEMERDWLQGREANA